MITLTFLGLDGLTAVDWALIVALLAISLIALSAYTFILYRRVPQNDTPLLNQEATIVAWQGRDQRVEVFGAIWRAKLASPSPAVTFDPGDIVRVTAVDNLVLIVTPV